MPVVDGPVSSNDKRLLQDLLIRGRAAGHKNTGIFTSKAEFIDESLSFDAKPDHSSVLTMTEKLF